MRVSSKLQVEGVRIVSEIGRIEAASDWRAGSSSSEESMQRALEKLKQLAAEFEADAIVGVDYSVDAVQTCDLAPVPMKRVSVSGVAVKLARD
ncbi:MAG TPA: heavy metal-binding domain-containing protein [Beijerinckiaceae bacterium]